MDNRYSVLMSVYDKERPEYLQAAIESMLNQTLKAYEIVLVCDGPLTKQLDEVINKYSEQLRVVRLFENCGLGNALSEGMKYCQCEWIARMDSDDIAPENRCKLMMDFILCHDEVDVISGTVAEFTGNCVTVEEAKKRVLAYKTVPQKQEDIEKYIKFRNPVNHPCVMFRKSKVQQAGGYGNCLFFEDYDLWVRMFLNQCKFANLQDVILYMRVDGMHQRRGGLRYAKAIIVFWSKMYKRRMISFGEYLYMIAMRVGVSLLPNAIRKKIYDRKLRKH